MGQQNSKDQSLYQQVSYGNVDGIKALHREGAKLEYVDREGKTPLIAACLNPALYNVAKTLLELGANVNAYRPGRNGGTALHHAAKRGLENTVTLLLSHGANALSLNDDCQTPLDIARAKGYSNLVRAIESHICLYAGWVRELYGPGFLEKLAPQLLSRKVWAVVYPCGSRNLRKPFKLELAIYASIQDAQPRTTIALWRANIFQWEPAFNQPDPAVIISETSTISRHGRRRRCRPRRVSQIRIKLAPVNESDKQQLWQFCNACKGIPQVMHSNFPFNTPAPVVPATIPGAAPGTVPGVPPVMLPGPAPANPTEDVELAMAINASLQSALQEGTLSLVHGQPSTGASSSASVVHSEFASNDSKLPSNKGNCTDRLLEEEAGPSGSSEIASDDTQAAVPIPSAPALTDEALPDGPIHYPTIDSSLMDTSTLMFGKTNTAEDGSTRGGSSSCAICFDAPVEAACVPCGHMAGCISCLNEIKAKNWGCPVCRTKIDQVIKVYAV